MVTMKTIKLQSYCKPCTECAGRVRETLAGVSGVKAVDVSSWKSARVVVEAESGTSRDALAEALRAAGYSVVVGQPKGVQVWGAVAGIVGGAAFAAGHVVGFAGGGWHAAATISAWLNLVGVVSLVFAVVGVHESLGDRGGVLGGAAAVLAMLGFILLAGIDTLGIVLAYDLIPQAAREAGPILALSAIANVSLLTGLLLLAVELLRTGALPRFVPALLLLAILAFVPGYFGVAIGGMLGALFLGAGFAGAAPRLWFGA